MGGCEYYEELISAFIDGVLSEEERAALMEHMSGCASCQAYFDDQIAIHDAMDAGPVQAPEGFAGAVIAQVRKTPQEQPGRKVIPLRRWKKWAAAAACCAVAALGLWSFQGRDVSNIRADQAAPAGSARGAVEMGDACDAGGVEGYALMDEESVQETDGWAELEQAYKSDAIPGVAADVTGGLEAAGGGETPAPAPAQFSVQDSAASNQELVDFETAEEQFGHSLIPCTADNFEGYILRTVGTNDSQGALCTAVDYQFSSGWIQVADQDRQNKSMDWFLTDTESVVYNGETFYVKDASLEGYTSIQYYPTGGSGLSYTGCFDTGMEQDEMLDLLLSVVVP